MKQLRRSSTDRVIGGVCAGLATYLSIDPLLVRILFLVLGIMTGTGFLVYMILWLLVPVEDLPFATHDEVVKSNVEEIRERAEKLGEDAKQAVNKGWTSRSQSDRTLLVGIGLATVGVLMLLRSLGLLTWMGRLWPLVLVALGVLILVNNLRDRP
jgi:phage shock protein PspC (stress-responsive transcriptional regulator)